MNRLVSLLLLLLLLPGLAHAQAVPPPRFDLEAAIADGPPMSAELAASRVEASSPSLERARALHAASEAAVARTRAMMLPRLDLSARYAHVDGFPDGQVSLGQDPEALAAARMLADRVSDPAARQLWIGSLEGQGGTVTFEIPRDQVAFSARLTWPVTDLFFALLPGLEAAEAGTRARTLAIDVAASGQRLRARETFYEMARARGQLAVAEQSLRQAEAQREAVEAAVRAGLSTEADRLGAAARVAGMERAVAAARAGVEVTDAALRVLLDEDDGPWWGIDEPLLASTEEAIEPATTLTARGLARRPELAALRATLDAQRAAGRAADAQGFPRVALFAGADLAAPNRYVIPPSSELQPSWEVGAQLTWSPNDALIAAHRGEELRAEQAETEARITELERGVRLEVRQAHARVTAAGAGLAASVAASEAAEAAYAERLAAFRAGEATVTDVLAAQTEVDRARLAMLDAAIDLRLARARLRHATGG